MHITRKHTRLLMGVVIVMLVFAVGVPYSGLNWTALAQYGSTGSTNTTVVATRTGNNGVTYQLLSNGNVIVNTGNGSVTVNTSRLIGRDCVVITGPISVGPGITAYSIGLDTNYNVCVWQLNVGFLDDTAEIWVFPGGLVELRGRA